MRAYFAQKLKPKFNKLIASGASPKRLLDIGIANHSYTECKAIFPNTEYHGIDHLDLNITMATTDRFFLCDLESPHSLSEMEPIYDVIIANHVLEHLERGREVFEELCCLLAKNGFLYAEFPSIRTAYSAKHANNYHFHDDPTHRTFYNLEDLANSAMRNNCKIISCGPASTWLKDILSYPRAALGLLKGEGWGPYLIHFQRKIDHILVQRRD